MTLSIQKRKELVNHIFTDPFLVLYCDTSPAAAGRRGEGAQWGGGGTQGPRDSRTQVNWIRVAGAAHRGTNFLHFPPAATGGKRRTVISLHAAPPSYPGVQGSRTDPLEHGAWLQLQPLQPL